VRTVKQLMRAADPVPNRDAVPDPRLLAEILESSPAVPVVRRRPRRWVLVTAAVVVVAAGAGIAGVRLLGDDGSPGESADEPYYATTDRLEGAASVILRGTITGLRDYDRDGTDETEATVTVSKVAKGDWAAGRSAEVVFTRIGSGPEAPTGLHQGGEYVLLLSARDSALWNLVNSDQGYYGIAGGAATPAADNSVPLSAGVRHRLGLE
jgi:hypothetical protein